jgi:transposase
MKVLDCQTREVSAEIRSLVMEREDAMLLTSIHGAEYYNALSLIAEIGDVNKFPDSEKLCSYAGLVPSVG